MTVTVDPVAEILELDRSRVDPRATVRRRAAQRLPRLAADHPTLALATAQRWIAEGGDHTETVVRRGLRPLIDQRDPTALRLAGWSPSVAVRVVGLALADDPAPAFGGRLRFEARVVSAETHAVPVLVEHHLEHRDANGAPRVGSGRLIARTLEPFTDQHVARSLRLPSQPSHGWAPGPAGLTLTVNGRIAAAATFVL